MFKQLLYIVFGFSVFLCSANAANFYVSTTGSDSNSGTAVSPWKTISISVSKLSPGDILNVNDGIYFDSIAPTVSGTQDQLIVVRAINPFGVTIDGGGNNVALDIRSVSHLVFEGFKLRNSGERAVLQVISPDNQPASGNTATHHIYLNKISVKGTCALNNCNAALITRANDVVLEDSWIYGSGRYTLLLYGSRNVTVRRVAVRWDYWDGANYKPNDPRNALGVYNSKDNVFENIIVLDSANRPAGRAGDKGALVLAGGDNGVTAPFISSDNNKILGAVVLNNVGSAIKLESRSVAHNNNYFDNVVVSGNSIGGITILKKVSNTLFNNLTIVGEKSGAGYANWSSDPDTYGNTIQNSIITDNPAVTFQGGRTEKYNIVYNNSPDYASGSTPGVGSVVTDPAQLYLFKNNTVEIAAHVGSEAKNRGAHLMYRYYDGVESTESLWPWLYEAEIHKDFCDPASLTELGRTGDNTAAWCDSGKSLTRYLWNTMSTEACPAEVCDVNADPVSQVITLPDPEILPVSGEDPAPVPAEDPAPVPAEDPAPVPAEDPAPVPGGNPVSEPVDDQSLLSDPVTAGEENGPQLIYAAGTSWMLAWLLILPLLRRRYVD